MFSVPAIPKPPSVRGIDGVSVNVTYNPSTQQGGGFPEKFYIVYKEKGNAALLIILTKRIIIHKWHCLSQITEHKHQQ